MKYWTRQESKERLPKAISPLGWSLLHVPLEATLARMSETLGVKKYSRAEMIIWVNFYVYSRKDFFSDIKNLKFNYPKLLKLIFLGIAAFFHVVFRWFKEKGKFEDRLSNRLFFKVLGSEVEKLIARWPSQINHLKEIMGRDFALQNVNLIKHETFVKIRTQMQEDSKEFFAEDFNVYFFKKVIFSLLASQLVSAGMSKEKAEETLSSQVFGLKGNYSISMIEDFNNPELSTADLKKRYGHLTDNWDIYSPTLGENESIWANRTFSVQATPAVKHNEKTKDLEEIKTLLAWNPEINILIDWLQKLVIMDEDLRAYSSLQYPQARVLMNKVEKTEAFKELIMHDNGIYFLHLNEIEFGLKSNDFHQYFEVIKERRANFESALKTNPPFDLMETNPGSFKTLDVVQTQTDILKGSNVSSGRIEGVITHINNYSDLSKINSKSILVLESATPVFAPFYALCGGIISEMGGHLSHGAIVAREYGIPMLTGVPNVCLLLEEGQSVLMDADAGTIKVIK